MSNPTTPAPHIPTPAHPLSTPRLPTDTGPTIPAPAPMRIGSLFSGIGGLELGLEMAGVGETIWQVERDAFCRAVLAHHWPDAERFDDVCAVGANLAPVDLICGGFPCQDVSSAGKGAGLAGERSGLWSQFARVVGEIRPSWVVVENVASGAGRWLDAVVRELEKLGYACLPVPVSARDVGAPHIRARVFVVAHADGVRELQPSRGEPDERGRPPNGAASDAHGDQLRDDEQRDQGRCDAVRNEGEAIAGNDGAPRDAADAHDPGREGPGAEAHASRRGSSAGPWGSPEPGVVPLVHGLPGGLAGRKRRARIRALGNSVVPQCAETVGWVIRELSEAP